MHNLIKDKKVLFITTKNLDYIRNTQEINIIKENASSYKVIGSYKKSYIKRLISVYWSILTTSMKNFDITFVGFSPQLIIPFWRWKFKKNFVIIDFFISMYDTFIFDRKKFKENSLMAKILKKIDTITIKSAKKVISDTKAHGDYFISEFGLDEKNLKVLYLEADKKIYYQRNLPKLDEFADKFTVLYFGSILPLQGIDIVLDAVNRLKDNKEIEFIIIGPIEKKYNKVISDNVLYFDWLSQDKLAEYIDMADLCLAGHFNKNINKAKRTIPGKAYIYEAMNKPMILGDNSATHELYNEGNKNIYFVEMGSGEALATKILQIKERLYKKTSNN